MSDKLRERVARIVGNFCNHVGEGDGNPDCWGCSYCRKIVDELVEVFASAPHALEGESSQPPAPQLSEVRDIVAEARTFLINMRRDAADAEDPELSDYAQAMEQYLDEIDRALRAAAQGTQPPENESFEYYWHLYQSHIPDRQQFKELARTIWMVAQGIKPPIPEEFQEKLAAQGTQESPTEMNLCEIHRLVLHKDQAYIFRQAEGCEDCAAYLNAPVATPAPLALDELRQRIAMAFYEAEKHVPAKDGHCDKCGFCHCEVGHVLAMAHEGVDTALAKLAAPQAGTPGGGK